MVLNQAQNDVFCHFIEFGSYAFLEIVYSDNLRQCLTSSKGKTHEKKTELGPIGFGSKSDLKIVFLSFSQVWFLSFLLYCIG